MRPVSAEFETSQEFGEGATAGVAPSWTPNTIGWYVRLYGNYQELGHAGKDIKCPIGTPIHAPADGTVLYAGWTEDLPGTGNVRKWLLYYNFGGIVTVIQHDGWISVIAHQSDNNAVHVGMKVKEGQFIGKSGNTKTRTTYVAPHVHCEALVYMDYRTDVRRGIIYGRVNPDRFFGSAAIAPQGATTPVVKKESEVPAYTRITAPAVRRRLAKGKAMTLVTDATNTATQNFAVLGLGHYDIDLFLEGTDLPAGETITVQFQIIPTGGKPSGYFREEIHGSADGTFSGRAKFKMPILKAARLEATITSSKESAYINQYSADVYAWKKG